MKKTLAIVFLVFLFVSMLTATTQEIEELNKKLRSAIAMGNVDEVRKLIEAGMNVKFKFKTKPGKGLTPLLFVCMFGIGESVDRGEIAKLLIDAGANINKKYGRMSLLHVAALSESKNKAVIEILAANGLDVNKYCGRSTPLHLAASNGRAGAVEALIDNGADMEARESVSGYTALHLAVLYHHKEAVETLIAKGADINAKQYGKKKGETPLNIAMRQGNFHLAELIRKHGGKSGRE